MIDAPVAAGVAAAEAVLEGLRAAVVEVRRAEGEPAQRRRLEATAGADVVGAAVGAPRPGVAARALRPGVLEDRSTWVPSDIAIVRHATPAPKGALV